MYFHVTGERGITYRNSKGNIKVTKELCSDNMLQKLKPSIQVSNGICIAVMNITLYLII